MRSERRKTKNEILHCLAWATVEFVKFIHENHHRGDCRIEAQRLDVLADFLDYVMQMEILLGCRLAVANIRQEIAFSVRNQSPDAVQEAVNAADSVLRPRFRSL